MTMKLKDVIDLMDLWEETKDVYTDYTDELAIAYVGTRDVTRTDECLKTFQPLWGLDVDVRARTLVVLINQYEQDEADRLNDLLQRFFGASAGYVACDTYEKWFKEH